MKKTMKAAVINEHLQDLEIKEVPVPEPSRGEVLVKAEASGVCHTDLHAKIGDWPVKPNLPLIPGHESIGKIVEVGEGVTSLKVGDRIGNAWLHSACGECEYCLTGQETLCHYQENSGYSVDGGYAEYFIAQADYAAKIPENLTSEEAAPLLCAGVTTYKALKISGAKPGDWVSVFGIGGLGHLAVQYAKAMGMNVVAVDIHDEKLELAKKLGADKTVNSVKSDPVEFINNEVGGVQASISVAVVPKAFEQAYDSMKRGGTLVAVALPNDDMALPIFETVLDAKKVTGSIVGTRKDLQEALDFAAQGKVKANISVEPLENINDIFKRMEEGKIDGRIVMSIE